MNEFLAGIIKGISGIVGNYGWAMIIFTILVRLVLTPFDVKSRVGMRRMTAVQPKVVVLQKKYANDKDKLNAKTAELYKKEKVNPLTSCLPLLLTWPILIAVFAAMRMVANEMMVDQVKANGDGLVGSTKNRYSVRTASIEGEYGSMLLTLAQEAIERGETYVCDRGTGKLVRMYRFREQWYEALDKAGVERVTLQSLRPAWSTKMLSGNADLTAINLSMGHAADSHVLVTNYIDRGMDDAPVLGVSWDNPSKSVQNS